MFREEPSKYYLKTQGMFGIIIQKSKGSQSEVVCIVDENKY